jgi:hypothetical protein
VIRLALRLVRAGGVRPGLLLASSAIGMLLLLTALATPHAHDRQVWREAARSDPAQYRGSAPHLLWLFDERPPIDGRQLLRAAVAETAPGAPAPLGASRVPRPGEVFVSAALARALRGSDGASLRTALPGRVGGRLTNAIVSRPGELIYMVGYRPAQMHSTAFIPVRSFVPRAGAGASAGAEGFAYSVGFAVLIAAALVTIALVIANASRVGARRREARLSALRLAGADHGQLARLIAIEAAITALPGALVGAVIALELRSAVASWPFGLWPILSSDLTMPGWEFALAVAALPVLAFSSALSAMRGAAIDPLGVRRHTFDARPRAVALLLPIAGWALLGIAAIAGDGLSEQGKELVAIVGASVAAGGVALCGPWLAVRCADAARRLARGPAVLLGARHLSAHPRSAFRAVASLVLGLFVVSLSLTYFESHVPFSATASATPSQLAANATHIGVFASYGVPGLVDARLEHALAAVPGVRAVRSQGGTGESPRTLIVDTDGTAPTVSRIADLVERTSPGLTASPTNGYLPSAADDPGQLKRTVLDDAQSLLWILDALAAASLTVAAIDGIGDRRRSLAALRAIGVSSGELRRAIALEVLAPFAIASVTAVAFGVIVGATLVELTSQVSPSVPWSTLATWLGIAAIAAIAATIATATCIGSAIRPEHLRSE